MEMQELCHIENHMIIKGMYACWLIKSCSGWWIWPKVGEGAKFPAMPSDIGKANKGGLKYAIA
jgi:hypothetical protein